jgi:RNA polymerase sigma-70 factor, ECF subfamily
MLRSIPVLRQFAKSLTGDADRANDLVQDALLRAIASIDSFQSGTNMEAWLLTILRNSFLSQYRKHRHELAYKASLSAERGCSHATQYSTVQLREVQQALVKVPRSQRDALLLVSAYGYSYAEAAAICHCPSGTIKSRANRARVQLTKLMNVDRDEFGPSGRDLAVLEAASSVAPRGHQLN